MEKIILTLSILALVSPLGACNSQTAGSAAKKTDMEQAIELTKKHRSESYDAVKEILNVYASNLPGKLEALVSNGYMPSKQEFINHVERSALEKTITNIMFSVEKTSLNTEGNLSVSFKWDRAYMPKGSTFHARDSGITNFVFVKESGGWRLLQMSGTDIF